MACEMFGSLKLAGAISAPACSNTAAALEKPEPLQGIAF